MIGVWKGNLCFNGFIYLFLLSKLLLSPSLGFGIVSRGFGFDISVQVESNETKVIQVLYNCLFVWGGKSLDETQKIVKDEHETRFLKGKLFFYL